MIAPLTLPIYRLPNVPPPWTRRVLFGALDSHDSLTFSEPPKKKQPTLVQRVKKKVLELLRSLTYKLGLMEWHRKAHLALYPGWEKALADTKKNAIAQSEVGGLQLLPAYRNPETKLIEFPEGQLFIDDFPIYSYPLYGMNVWLNSQYLPDEIKPSNNRSEWYGPSRGCRNLFDDIKKTFQLRTP